jgi:hypothetical protein
MRHKLAAAAHQLVRAHIPAPEVRPGGSVEPGLAHE